MISLNKSIKIFSIIASTVIVGGILVFSLFVDFAVADSQIEKEYFSNQKMFEAVAKYLNEQKSDSIYITCTDNRGEMFVSGKMIHISDESVSDMIYDLFAKYKISVITKNTIQNSNYICFQRWANRNTGKGLLFSADGKFPANNRFIELEHLENNNWFIYKET